MTAHGGATRLPVIGVMGSSQRDNADLAGPLGTMLAGLPVHLLTGAGQATMAAVSHAFAAVSPRRGLVIGVVPAAHLNHPTEPVAGYPNPWVEIAIHTHLVTEQPGLWDGLTRNHINILTSDVVIALPGSAGTRHEIEMAVAYGKPVATFFHDPNEMGPLPEVVRACPDLDAVKAFITRHLMLEADAPPPA